MLSIILFELRQKSRSISTYIYFLMFFSLAMLWIAAAGGVFDGAVIDFGGKVHINSPMAISQTVTFLGYLGVVIVAAMMGRAIQQDTEHNIWHFFYSAPLSKLQYLGGRYMGALLTLILIFSSISLGAWLGCYLPGVGKNFLGTMIPAAYLAPYFTSLIPNLMIFGALFFTLGALYRRMLPVYVSSVVLLIGYLVAGGLARDIDDRTLAALIDPFGSRAISRVTEYWSIADKNSRIVPLQGLLLYNRLIWGAVGILAMVFCYWRFDFAAISAGGKQKKIAAKEVAPASIQIPVVTPNYGGVNLLSLFISQCWLNLRETVKNVYFIVIALTGVMFMFSLSNALSKMYGTTTYPVTYAVLDLLGTSFSLFMLIITTFYAGELVWRERDARIAQLLDALPVPNWLPLLSKLVALISLQGILLFVLMICGIIIQTAKGYTHYELSQYLEHLFLMQWPAYALIAVLAVAVQVILNNKYVGYFVMIAYYIATIALPSLGIEHPMVMYGGGPTARYSDMDGFGHNLPQVFWYQLYWSGAALILLGIAMLMWVRGTTVEWRNRLRLARHSVTPAIASVLVVGSLLFAGVGGLLFYYTNIINHYQSSFDSEADRANYEKQYKKYEALPQPRITDIKVAVDIFPDQRTASAKASYQLVNKGTAAISEIFISQAEDIDVKQLHFDRTATPMIQDKKGFYSYKLTPALDAGDKLGLDIELAFAPKGIAGMGSDSHILHNGTFFNSGSFPSIGYQSRAELSDEKERKKHGLPEKERMADRDDPKGLANSYIANDADWIRFDATVSTSADQIGIAPGRLIKEWTENGRRYFYYAPDKPVLNFFAFMSARYSVKKAQWNDVAIEIDYQKGHEYNLDRMIKGVQESLTYYTQNFGPYQHKMVRIIEFPRYASFAQAFPNTIPFSESIGFIAKVDDQDPKDLDYPFYVTAHEVAHQWWAHQVVSGNTKGATILVETLAQYSALMVMEKTYGKDKMRKFLKYELDRYLMGRSRERKKELPIAFNENQDYIHYAKGSLVMYLLQDQIGQDKVNAALRDVIAQYANQGAPYPSSKVLVDALRKVTPEDKQGLITDLFESIVLFENRALTASAKSVGNGQYEVTLTASSNKLKADELGVEKELPLHDWIDIGVDDKDGKPLFRERKLIDRKEVSYTILVKGEPAKAGIDPDNKYIDRKPEDNLIKVEMPAK
ncbi:ABC transporter permease/M1 family aminopeptidase [Undibacterium sp. Xuan67W]|uniref:ABC transporter permease/M1 family aminopeptidase n=1 Tax=Undibacterium sp. Xuan67W TaxID=3413057 RepID=UPI003BEFDE2C